MIVKIFFSPDEITTFFVANGFTVEQRMFGEFVSQYHGRSEWVEREGAAVVIGDVAVKAETLFEKVAEYRIKSLVAPLDKTLKSSIESLFKELLNNHNQVSIIINQSCK